MWSLHRIQPFTEQVLLILLQPSGGRASPACPFLVWQSRGVVFPQHRRCALAFLVPISYFCCYSTHWTNLSLISVEGIENTEEGPTRWLSGQRCLLYEVKHLSSIPRIHVKAERELVCKPVLWPPHMQCPAFCTGSVESTCPYIPNKQNIHK